MKNIVVLVSGGGTNLQALIDAQKNGKIPNGKITCVISSNPDAYALTRAKENGIGTRVIVPKEFASREMYSKALLEALFQEYADLIVLAGFMTILDQSIIRAYHNQIINVHPSLIPSFCGEGFYGLHVHEAALARGVKFTGATVHLSTKSPMTDRSFYSSLLLYFRTIHRKCCKSVSWNRRSGRFCHRQ